MTNRLLLAGDEEGFQLVAPTAAPTAADCYAAVVALEVDSQSIHLTAKTLMTTRRLLWRHNYNREVDSTIPPAEKINQTIY